MRRRAAGWSAEGWTVRLVALYAILIPLQPILTMPDGSPLRFAAADLVAPLVVLAALAKPRRRLPSGLGTLAVAIPLLALFSTLLAARDRSLSTYAIGKTVGLFYLVGLCLAVTRGLPAGTQPAVLRALARGAFWSAAIGLIGFAAWLEGVPTSLVQDDRLCSTMTGDPNIYCSLLAVGLLATAGDAEGRGGRRLARAAVIALALLLTGSRSGVVAAVVGFLVAGILRNRDRWAAAARAVYVTALSALPIGAILATQRGWSLGRALWEHLWRMFTIESRFDLYARALHQFTEHPIVGLGVGGFWDLNTWYAGGLVFHSAVHNTYLWALVDLGVGGCLLVLALLAAAIWRCVRAAGDWPPAVGATTTGGALAAMAVFNLFIDGLYQRHFWLLMACALGIALPRGASRDVARAVPVAPGWAEA